MYKFFVQKRKDKFGDIFETIYFINTSLQVFQKNNAQGTLCSIISLPTNTCERK